MRSRTYKKRKGGQLMDQLTSMAQQASKNLVEQGKQLTETATKTVKQIAQPVSQAVVGTAQPVVQSVSQPLIDSAKEVHGTLRNVTSKLNDITDMAAKHVEKLAQGNPCNKPQPSMMGGYRYKKKRKMRKTMKKRGGSSCGSHGKTMKKRGGSSCGTRGKSMKKRGGSKCGC